MCVSRAAQVVSVSLGQPGQAVSLRRPSAATRPPINRLRPCARRDQHLFSRLNHKLQVFIAATPAGPVKKGTFVIVLVSKGSGVRSNL